MTDKLENYNSIAVFGDANRVSAASGPSTMRKPWATPQVILATMEDTEGGVAAGLDGGAGPSTNS